MDEQHGEADDNLQHLTQLVHMLQKERGMTCGLVGSGGAQYFAALVSKQRELTDGMSMEPESTPEESPSPYVHPVPSSYPS